MADHRLFAPGPPELPFMERLARINWTFVGLLCLIAGAGFAMLYSVAGGALEPWALRQMMRFAVGLVLFTAVAVIHVETLFRMSYAVYVVALILLAAVNIFGGIGMGAQRWINLGLFQVQPSEVMKIALILALARYFHSTGSDEVLRLSKLVPPTLMLAVPVALTLHQPDLGTALLMLLSGVAVFFLAGARARLFVIGGLSGIAAIPVAWRFLHDYQKDRILTFLSPERDPLGSGYHIIQSKIALGSGGLLGKGFIQGTQSHLNFLPEKHTDFIFTMLSEEFGLIGGLTLLALYVVVLIYGYVFAMNTRNQFGRLVVMGITFTFFLYFFMNMAMVMGLVPVVGVPLPLVSYGGTAMLSLLIGFGLMMSVYIHRDLTISKSGIVR